MMNETSDYPFEVQDVAGALIVRGKQILAVYSRSWKEFTLPTTRRRKWQDPKVPGGYREEAWIDAAARAAAEWLERTCSPEPEPVVEEDGYQQSGRDGIWRRYNFKLFRVLPQDAPLPRGKVAEWLTMDQFLEEDRRPISATARHLVAALKAR